MLNLQISCRFFVPFISSGSRMLLERKPQSLHFESDFIRCRCLAILNEALKNGLPILCSILSAIVALLGFIPSVSWFIVKNTLGKSWSSAAVDAACSRLVKYHTMRNMLFLTLTEFQKFSEAPDWDFMKERPEQYAFLFGIDDHWGPLSLFEEISKKFPDVSLSIEKEGHDHAFCTTEVGSIWVAQHVAGLIQKHL